MGSLISVINKTCLKDLNIQEIPEISTHVQLPIQESQPANSINFTALKEKLSNQNTSFLHDPTRLSQLSSMPPSSKELRLKVKNSPFLPKELVVNISYKGYMDSQTAGVTYFGSKRKSTKGGARVCDFIIPCEDKEYGRMFVIYYCVDSDNYFLRDLGIGPGVYLKLDYSFKLTSDILVNIGETHLYFKITIGSNSYPNLLLTVFSNGLVKTFCFYAQEQHISPVRIGRAKDCDICINDMMLSKYQASILYSHSQGWMLIDGNLIRQRPSTNGSWLLCSNDTVLSMNSEIKVASSLFKVQITS